jgi:Tfp pilus assembly protein PilF
MANKCCKTPNYSIILSIISVSLLVYLNALKNGFVWDDMVLIVDNEGIKHWSCLWKNFTSDFFDTTEDIIDFKYGYYRPIITLSYIIDYAIWGLKPWGFHLSNIIFHIIGCILVFFSLSVIFNKRGTAFIASLLFACHPIHTESVTWISGRTDVIAGLFFLSAFYLYQKAFYVPIHTIGAGRTNGFCERAEGESAIPSALPVKNKLLSKQSKIVYPASVILFAIAMFCKEMVATLPFLIIAYTLYFSEWKGLKRWKMSLILSSPYFLVLAFYGIIRFVILKISTVNNPGGEAMKGVYPTLLSFIKAIFLYLYKLVYPFHLSAYIQNPVSFSIAEPVVILSIVGVIVLLFFTVWLRRRWTPVSFMILFFLVSLLPLSNIVRISAPWDMGFVVAERFLYIPSIGFCGVTAVFLKKIYEKRGAFFRSLRNISILLIIGLLAVYSVQTFFRNRIWTDEKSFFLETLKDAPEAALLHHALGNVYVREENYNTAFDCYKKSLELYPFYHAAYNNIGTIYSKFGLFDQAITAFKEAIKINSDYIQAHFNLGTMYYQTQKISDASDEFRKVIKLSDRYVRAHNNLGIIYAENGQPGEALAEFEAVIKYDPYNEKARNNLEVIKEELAKERSLNKNLP